MKNKVNILISMRDDGVWELTVDNVCVAHDKYYTAILEEANKKIVSYINKDVEVFYQNSGVEC